MRNRRVQDASTHDDGCDVAPHCVACPLVQCKYDDPAGYKLWKSAAWDAVVAKTHEVSGSITAVATAHKVSKRTIYRSLNRTTIRRQQL